MQTRLLTFGVWALVAFSALFWGLRLFAAGPGLPPEAQAPARSVAAMGALPRLLGAGTAAADPAADDAPDDGGGQLRLLGVVAPRGAERSPQGVALIAVGDQPARAWRTGSVVDGDLVLLSVSRRGAQLGPRGGPATTELSLPDPVPNRPAAAGAALPTRNFGSPPVQGAVRPLGMPQPVGVAPRQGQDGAADGQSDDEE